MFRNSGYFYYKPEYITYRADTIQRPGFVQLQVVPADGIPASANKGITSDGPPSICSIMILMN